ncbi:MULTISPECIES: hypothetical protein [Olivibacter]|uniref:Uncharacterized protein n=1 Tax=Olivibacter jilunii TaxID=985016 RepID=A0ABW6AZY1_9SPHI
MNKAKGLRDLHFHGEKFLTEGKIYEGRVAEEEFETVDDKGTPIFFNIGIDVKLIEE